MSSLMSLFNTFHFLLKFFCVIKFCLALVVLPLLLVVLVIVVVVAVVTSSGSNTVNCSCTSCCFCVSLRLLRPAATCRSGRNILYPLLSHPHILALTLSHIKIKSYQNINTVTGSLFSGVTARSAELFAYFWWSPAKRSSCSRAALSLRTETLARTGVKHTRLKVKVIPRTHTVGSSLHTWSLHTNTS